MQSFSAIVLASVIIDSLLQQLFLGVLGICDLCLEGALFYCEVSSSWGKRALLNV